MRTNHPRPSRLVLVILGLIAVHGTPAHAATVLFSQAPDNILHLTGALGTDWRISNHAGTDTGLPTGMCAQQPGLSIVDAAFDPNGVNKGDAYDNGFTFWVDNALFASSDFADITGQTFTSGPRTMSGLDVTVQYTAMQTMPVLRMVVALRNQTSATIRPRSRMVTNFGSDGNTTYLATPNGDQTLDYTDNWVVSSDNPTTPGDAPQVTAVCGPRNPFSSDTTAAKPPSCFGLDDGAFSCNGAQGVTAQFIFDVPPGRTVYLMFFGQLAGTNSEALAAAVNYNVMPDRTSELFADLSDAQLLATWNWQFFGEHRLFGGGPGAGTSWSVWNSAGASDPVTGYCDAVPGLAVRNARLVDPERGAAFDDGLMLYVDGQPFASQLDPPSTDHHLLAGPMTMSGLAVTVDYTALTDAPALRTMFSFTNATATPISTTALLASNFGTDAETVVHGSSSGDMAIGADDRWIVTGENTFEFYVHVTHVLFGPGVVTPPTSIADKTFECIRDDANGIAATYKLTVPPGETRRLMFFNELYANAPDAVAAAALYDTTPAPGSSRLVGLDAATLLETVNWAFCSDGSFDGVGCRLDGLGGEVGRRLGAGTLTDRLTAAVDKAHTQTMTAQGLRAAGKMGPARKAIAKAVKALQSFAQLLKSKKAKGVPQADRDALNAIATAQRTALAALKRAG